MSVARPLPSPLEVTIRPITPGDRDALANAFGRLSPASRYRRFLTPKPSLSPAELDYLTDVDHHRHEAIVAVDAEDGRIIGVARYAPLAPLEADFAIVVADEAQGRGLGTSIAYRLLAQASANGLTRLRASTLADNRAARALLRRLGFRVRGLDHGVLELELRLA
jgi:RimJ/RimL family protein N-acetyltransferase